MEDSRVEPSLSHSDFHSRVVPPVPPHQPCFCDVRLAGHLSHTELPSVAHFAVILPLPLFWRTDTLVPGEQSAELSDSCVWISRRIPCGRSTEYSVESLFVIDVPYLYPTTRHGIPACATGPIVMHIIPPECLVPSRWGQGGTQRGVAS